MRVSNWDTHGREELFRRQGDGVGVKDGAWTCTRYLHGWRRVGGGISQTNDQGNRSEHAALVVDGKLNQKGQINRERGWFPPQICVLGVIECVAENT